MSLSTVFSTDPLGFPHAVSTFTVAITPSNTPPRSETPRILNATLGSSFSSSPSTDANASAATSIATDSAIKQHTATIIRTSTAIRTSTVANTATNTHPATNTAPNPATNTETATSTDTTTGQRIVNEGSTTNTAPNQSTLLDNSVSNGQTTSQTTSSAVFASPTDHSFDTGSTIGSLKYSSQDAIAAATAFTFVGLAMVAIVTAIVKNAIRHRRARSRLENGRAGSHAHLCSSSYTDAAHGTFSRPPTTTGESYDAPRRVTYGYPASTMAVDVGVLGMSLNRTSPYNAPPAMLLHPYENGHDDEQHYGAPRGSAARNPIDCGAALDGHPGRRQLLSTSESCVIPRAGGLLHSYKRDIESVTAYF
ncbi:hypothetical protein C8Q73DRAFT_668231 [Cubamyces lactineus]|nr:hypothetical protein C8Q73DRAFT_668231 [Cubamyces lactineus]